MEPNPLRKNICGVKLVQEDGSGRDSARRSLPPATGRWCAALLLISWHFTPFQPFIGLSVGRPPSWLPPVHAASQAGDGAAACRLPCLPSQSPLQLVGSSCRLFAFLHGFQVKSLRMFIRWCDAGRVLSSQFGMFPKAPCVPLWPPD